MKDTRKAVAVAALMVVGLWLWAKSRAKAEMLVQTPAGAVEQAEAIREAVLSGAAGEFATPEIKADYAAKSALGIAALTNPTTPEGILATAVQKAQTTDPATIGEIVQSKSTSPAVGDALIAAGAQPQVSGGVVYFYSGGQLVASVPDATYAQQIQASGQAQPITQVSQAAQEIAAAVAVSNQQAEAMGLDVRRDPATGLWYPI